MYYLKLGLSDYEKCRELQNKLVKEKFTDILILVEHPPVITLGHRGKRDNILISEAELKNRKIPVLSVERGGDVTYHCYGQLVVYPIINLCEYKLKVKEFIEKLEEVIILTLEFYSIKGTRNPLNHGVWIGQDKIASIGIGIRKWITFHGFTLNINTDLSGFNMIRACGLYNAGVTSMKKIMDREFSLSEVSGIIIDNFSKVFNVGLEEIVYEDLHQRIDYCEITKTKAPMAQDQTSLRGKLQKTY